LSLLSLTKEFADIASDFAINVWYLDDGVFQGTIPELAGHLTAQRLGTPASTSTKQLFQRLAVVLQTGVGKLKAFEHL
jgi:hypothetical protein